jgi:transcriptional regulator with XRE-family HTH domain
MREYRNEKAGKLKRAANHIRTDLGTEEALRLLGEDYLRHPINPLICATDLRIVEGNRRHAGVLLVAGSDAEVPICVTDEAVTEVAQIEIMLESAIHTRGLTPYEEFLGGDRWLERHPGSTAEQLAERIGRSQSMMSRILSLRGGIPAVKDAAAAGLLPVSEWPLFSRLSAQEQHELLKAKLSGQIKGRDDIARSVRKTRNGTSKAVSVPRVRLPLPGGAVVTLSGKDLDMTSVVEILADVLKEARKASDQYDLRTWQSMMRDKANA